MIQLLASLKKELQSFGNPEKALFVARFFKTGPGQYGEGDIFLGLSVPVQRKIAKKYLDLTLDDIQNLLAKKIHEYRLTSLFILIDKYNASASSAQEQKKIVDLYLRNSKRINNWDLVDISAPNILGDYLFKRERKILYKFARSENVWEKRIGIIATYGFIKKRDFADTLKIAEILLEDKHDLIHKAVGWMLREVGKRDVGVEFKFLDKHYQKMPRTMLRYAIEKFENDKKAFYMKKA